MSFCWKCGTSPCPGCAWNMAAVPMMWIPPVTTLDLDDDTEDTTPPDPPKCEDCGGMGEIELFTGKVDCERCGGSGY